MASLARAAASAARSALRPATLSGRVLNSPLPSPARAARILRRSAAAGLETLMPLHSAVASARMKSCIAIDSTCWSSLSQEMTGEKFSPFWVSAFGNAYKNGAFD